MPLQSTDFELFDLPARYGQDLAVLDARWKALQRQAHPDKFAAEGPAAQRVAAQWSARINEAYRRLKDPLQRAAYLCELHGSPINAENNTAMPAAFLMQQMQLREQADEARSPADFDALEALASQMQRDMQRTLEQQIDVAQDWAAAAQSVRALMFLHKLGDDIDRRRDAHA
ncbi:MAG: Fe-S protein assembly co-chaperone HscB [Comamonadaceae bacterium]|nr:Fe-S protein assembly co-chaperone HscB [Comamonadaceae bacterium]